ncbi:MAG: PD-(D/E)XK nuclease family protein [Roseburia sp.]|nr:PD-(D/E)XK nuclease family protein [Roseburia sp.]
MDRLYDSYPSALDALASELRSRKFSPNEYYVVLTPDRYTLHVEKALFKHGAAIDCEVLTLSRLCRRVLKNAKTLSREGGVMITARAAEAVKDKLCYYKNAVRYGEFAKSVYDALLQIAASGVEISEISAKGSLASKLGDLALIKAEYDRLKAEYRDSPDRLKELIAACGESEFIAKTRFFAIGYADATKLNREVFAAIKKHARAFAFYDAAPQTELKGDIEVYRAPDAVAQYKAVAARIREYVCKGGRYGDVSVVCPDPRVLARILREYDVDFYTDEATPLFETPPVALLSALYKLKTSGDTESLVSVCKNPFSGCDATDAERLQNYLYERGRDYGALDAEISDAAARRAVKRAKELLGYFEGDFSSACENVAERAAFSAVQSELYSDGTDMLSPVYSLTGMLRRYGSGDFETDAASFFSAARALEVKSLPRLDDRVTVAAPQSFRMTRCKMLFVTDFNEGVLPIRTADSGLLSDAELRASGDVIEPSAREKNRRDSAELAAVINNAEKVFCTYKTSGGARRSSMLPTGGDLASAQSGYIGEKTYEEEYAVLKVSADANYIARFAAVPSAARELAAQGLTSYPGSVSAAVGECDAVSPRFEPIIASAPRGKLSVSELTHWFYCPYGRFLTDTIGLKERRRGRTGAPEFGLIMHDFMKRFIDGGALDCSRKAVEGIVDGILEERGTEPAPAERERIIRDACDYAAANKAVLEAGSYRPTATEYPFGGKIFLGKDGASFGGVIDRIDECDGKIRIIDYKTGNKKFDKKMCLCGCDLQLPLYAAAARTGGKHVTGMFYMPLGSAYDGGDVRLSGCLIRDENIALEYDAKLENGQKSTVINAQFKTDGNKAVFARKNSQLLDEDEFDGLIDTSLAIANNAADEIAEGYIARSPVAGACDRCAYVGICTGEKKPRGVSDAEEEGGDGA